MLLLKDQLQVLQVDTLLLILKRCRRLHSYLRVLVHGSIVAWHSVALVRVGWIDGLRVGAGVASSHRRLHAVEARIDEG